MPFAIKASGPVFAPHIIKDEYVKVYDPEAFDGGGHAEFTNDPKQALVFAKPIDAMAFAYAVSKTRPLRADGAPNKPLNAFHLEFVEVEE